MDDGGAGDPATPVLVDGATLSCAGAVAVAVGGSPATLDPAALAAAGQAHAAVLEASARRAVYGRTTGVGANRDAAVDQGDDTSHDLRLLLSHAAGVGPPVAAPVVRGAMLIRLNQLAAAGSGIQPDFLRALDEALDRRALPVVHDLGSIGTGDLSMLAEVALTLTGHLAWGSGDVAPVVLEAGDALAFISSSALTLSRALLAWDELRRLLEAAQVVAALSYCALGGSPEAFAEEVHARRPHPGTTASAAAMRRLLWHEGDLSPGRRIQDPFGLRAFCQVHGPALEAADNVRRVLEIEMNAAAENPLVDRASGAVFHHGQFASAYLALGLDSLRAAVHHVAELSAARLGDLVEPEFTGLTPFLAAGPAASSGVMITEYVAHDALSRLRHAAGPVTLGTSVISRGVEDHASFSPLAARSSAEAASHYRTVLACELVAAVRALRLGETAPRGEVLAGVFAWLDDELPDTRPDHQLGEEIALAGRCLDALADASRWGRAATPGRG